MANIANKNIDVPIPQPPLVNYQAINQKELDSFNVFGVFNRMNDSVSPMEIQIKNTTIYQNQNRSFDRYFADMKKRNQLKGIITTNLGRTYRLVDAGSTKTIDPAADTAEATEDHRSSKSRISKGGNRSS